MEDKPKSLPTMQPNGKPLKSINELMLERRATNQFSSEEVPEEYLNAILKLGAQAPSGYNLQPWRFIVVRDEENRKRLQKVAFNQPKVAQAPVVIIALGMTEEWKSTADEVFQEGARRGAGNPEQVEQYKQGAIQFLSSGAAITTVEGLTQEQREHAAYAAWVNRHTMIAFTTLMIAAEAYGFDTAPMEGFDAMGVKREFNIPAEAEVVAMLAIGRAQEPDKPYTGRFPLERIVFSERYGEAWKR